MATLSAIKFSSAEGADQALTTLGDLQRQQLITVHDAAVVTWPSDKKRPKTRQAHNLAGAGALGGAFWGMLFGLIFFVPFLGAAIGAGIGAISGALTDVGIDDGFIDQVRDKVTPGTSALFALTSDAVPDRVIGAFREQFQGQHLELLSTNLSREQEDKLREAFAETTTA
ncbi:MAG: DUF1269 domain-containing protein [Candidatus Dormibacteraeota bacterium]|nr:DUF1269 domain-containing protein [Candidatus Dormibacteraeota bacterium]